jgi:hydrogenase maturation protein HypF
LISALSRVNVRTRAEIRGAVQGVGFRPFVYRLATELGLAGWVKNSSDGLIAELEGPPEQVEEFLDRLRREKPAAAMIGELTARPADPQHALGFEILPSDEPERRSAGMQADLATCPDCLRELFDPANRRHLYPFINCTHCGPRYTIVEEIPYDRAHTTMRGFTLCEKCEREYRDPSDRRFHAQPNACPDCGPALSASVSEAAEALERGVILALKGVGGFQLLVDARNESAVERLRDRKRRDEKPFAMLMASMRMIRAYCQVSPAEEELLRSPAAPIVLLRPNGAPGIAAGVAKSSPWFGVMLPCSPLHHLLARAFPFPMVATSGNVSEEPIAIDNQEALARLGENRRSVSASQSAHRPSVRRFGGRASWRDVRAWFDGLVGTRRCRCFVKRRLPPVLAVGGHMKNTVAIAVDRQVILSQHVGDLDTIEARETFEAAIDELCRLYRFKPEVVACDLHPDYASSCWARQSGLPVIPVQHHQAHVAACAAENQIEGPYLGVAWDGTGYGEDGDIWGSEMFLAEGSKFERIGHLRPFRLPAGTRRRGIAGASADSCATSELD